MEVKVGKSYTRRYYEDMLERFEAETKFITSKQEFEKKRLEIIMKIKNAYNQNLISMTHLHQYLQRLERTKFQEGKKNFSKEELKQMARISKNKSGEDGVSDKQDKNIEMASEKTLAEKNKQKKGIDRGGYND